MIGLVAQLAEQRTFNPRVAGSNPAGLTVYITEGKSKMGKVITIKPDWTVDWYESEKRPTLEELQKIVGGLIAPVDDFIDKENAKEVEAYVNDEGILIGLEPNYIGTKMVNWPETLFGPLVILEGFKTEEEEEEEAQGD
jgi:hypothetical protein